MDRKKSRSLVRSLKIFKISEPERESLESKGGNRNPNRAGLRSESVRDWVKI